jgi:hypothetical protein
MTFTPPVPWTTLAGIAAAVGGLTILAYVLKLRRRRHEVPFSKLWQRVLKERESSSLFRRLRRLISLAVQLAFVALLLFAATDPQIGEAGSAGSSGRNLVVIVDASASMKAQDEGPKAPARIERAKAAARSILRGLGGADAAMVVRMDGQTTALSRFEADVPHLVRVVDGIAASDTPADLHRALQAAADALRGRNDPMIVLIGDGAYPADAREQVTWIPAAPGAALGTVDLSGIDVRFVPVGKAGRNVGIVAFNVRRYLANKLSYEALVELENFGVDKETVQLTLLAGTDPISVKTLTLDPGERRREIYPDLGGGDDRALRAHIEPLAGPDAFPLDDNAFALLPERKKQKVLLVSSDNLYLEAALLLDPNIVVDKVRPGEYSAEKAQGYQVAVFDGWAPEGPPPTASLYFAGPFFLGPVPMKGELKRPFITDVNPDHPLTRWVTLADVNIDKAFVLAPAEGDTVIARSIRDPLIVAGKRDGKKVVEFGFGLDATDLMLRVAFPVLLVNALDWFAGDDAELITTYRTGRVWSIPVDADEKMKEVDVRGPLGAQKAPVTAGRARFYGQAVGIYTLAGPTGPLGVAANLADPLESDIRPQTTLVLGGKPLEAPPGFTPSVSRAIWVYLVLGALLLSSVEWLTYNRRITV